MSNFWFSDFSLLQLFFSLLHLLHQSKWELMRLTTSRVCLLFISSQIDPGFLLVLSNPFQNLIGFGLLRFFIVVCLNLLDMFLNGLNFWLIWSWRQFGFFDTLSMFMKVHQQFLFKHLQSVIHHTNLRNDLQLIQSDQLFVLLPRNRETLRPNWQKLLELIESNIHLVTYIELLLDHTPKWSLFLDNLNNFHTLCLKYDTMLFTYSNEFTKFWYFWTHIKSLIVWIFSKFANRSLNEGFDRIWLTASDGEVVFAAAFADSSVFNFAFLIRSNVAYDSLD